MTDEQQASHTNLDLQLVQKYVRYIELQEIECRSVNLPPRLFEEAAAIHDEIGSNADLLYRIARLSSEADGRRPNMYDHPRELAMAVAMWMLQRPGPEPELPSGHIDRHTGHEIPDVKQTDAQFTEDDLEKYAKFLASEADEEDDRDQVPYD